jgi:hypothetical protein
MNIPCSINCAGFGPGHSRKTDGEKKREMEWSEEGESFPVG